MQKIIHKENEVLLCRLQWPVSVKQTQSHVLVEMKRQDVFLANLGFVAGAEVVVLSKIGGNVIVNVKDSRVAVNEDMARHIMV